MKEPVSQAATSADLPASQFPQTHWSVVMAAGQADPAKAHEAEEALRELCVVYRKPIHSFLLRTGCNEHKAEDLTSGFIEHVLERNRLEGFERTNTKFRSFLLRCLQRFARDEWRKETAAKRGGGQEAVDLDGLEVGEGVEIERVLDFEFAKAVHRETMQKLGAEKHAEGAKKERFAALRQFVWGNDQDISYEEVGGPLHMTAHHVSKAVFDLRQDYYDYFRRVVSQTVSPQITNEETRYLMGLLAASGMAAET